MGIAAALSGGGVTSFLVAAAILAILGALFFALRPTSPSDWKLAAIIFAAAATTALLVWFADFVFRNFSGKDLGSAGDLFGGILNPIVALAALAALIYTIHLQRVELQLTRDEMKNSSAALEGQLEVQQQQLFDIKLQASLAVLDNARDSVHRWASYYPLSEKNSEDQRYFGQCVENTRTELSSLLAHPERNAANYIANPEILIESHPNEINRFTRALTRACDIVEAISISENKDFQIITSRMTEGELLFIYVLALAPQNRRLAECAISMDVASSLSPLFHFILGDIGDLTELLRLVHSLPASKPNSPAANS
jgi:hypothetical protein